jgi:hypothetical protein
MTNSNKTILWKFQVDHFVPEFAVEDDDGEIRVNYISTTEEREIELPVSVKDPQCFLDERSFRDATAAVSFSHFVKVDSE